MVTKYNVRRETLRRMGSRGWAEFIRVKDVDVQADSVNALPPINLVVDVAFYEDTLVVMQRRYPRMV